MKKIIYSNYKRQNKWLGIIDYKSLLFVIFYGIAVIFILKNLGFNFVVSFYIFVILMSPLIALSFVSTKNGSAIDVLILIIRYFFTRNMYINLKYYTNNKGFVYKNNLNKKL